MKFLTAFDAVNVQAAICKLDITDIGRIQILKIIGMGELYTLGKDCRVLLRPNSLSAGYKSFVVPDGNYGTGEWDDTGFYVGRSGFSSDATFSYEYTLTFISEGQTVNGFGISTFALSSQIIGYQANGFVGLQTPVTTLQLVATAGLLRHRARIFVG